MITNLLAILTSAAEEGTLGELTARPHARRRVPGEPHHDRRRGPRHRCQRPTRIITNQSLPIRPHPPRPRSRAPFRFTSRSRRQRRRRGRSGAGRQGVEPPSGGARRRRRKRMRRGHGRRRRGSGRRRRAKPWPRVSSEGVDCGLRNCGGEFGRFRVLGKRYSNGPRSR